MRLGRRSAASALGDIGTKATVALLAQIALNDPDPEVRNLAVLGLATATDAGEASTRDRFAAREAEIVASWRKWAAANAR